MLAELWLMELACATARTGITGASALAIDEICI